MNPKIYLFTVLSFTSAIAVGAPSYSIGQSTYPDAIPFFHPGHIKVTLDDLRRYYGENLKESSAQCSIKTSAELAAKHNLDCRTWTVASVRHVLGINFDSVIYHLYTSGKLSGAHYYLDGDCNRLLWAYIRFGHFFQSGSNQNIRYWLRDPLSYDFGDLRERYSMTMEYPKEYKPDSPSWSLELKVEGKLCEFSYSHNIPVAN